MQDAKKSNLGVCVIPVAAVGDVAVCLSFKSKLNACCLARFKGGCECSAVSDEAAVCYSLFLMVQSALCGDPLAAVKSKVSLVTCGAHDGEFNISWKVKGTMIAVRKSVGLALKCLSPARLYTQYSHAVKSVGGKPDRAAFESAAGDLGKAIKALVSVVVVGKIKVTKELLSAALDVLVKKIPAQSGGGSGSSSGKCEHDDKTELKVSGWQSFVVREFIGARLKGVNVQPMNGGLLIAMKPATWSTASGKLKSAVKDYVAARYGRVGDNLPEIMAYLMASAAAVCASDIHSVVKNKVKPADVERALSAAL